MMPETYLYMYICKIIMDSNIGFIFYYVGWKNSIRVRNQRIQFLGKAL